MEQIINNLQDPSWWFTGIFFIIIALLIGVLFTKWIPTLYRKVADKFPSFLKRIARKRRLNTLSKIHSLRFHPLLVIREISRADAMLIMMWVGALMMMFAYTTFPEKPDSILRSLSRIIFVIPLYALQIITMNRVKFLKELLKSCKKVGTSKFCTTSG